MPFVMCLCPSFFLHLPQYKPHNVHIFRLFWCNIRSSYCLISCLCQLPPCHLYIFRIENHHDNPDDKNYRKYKAHSFVILNFCPVVVAAPVKTRIDLLPIIHILIPTSVSTFVWIPYLWPSIISKHTRNLFHSSGLEGNMKWMRIMWSHNFSWFLFRDCPQKFSRPLLFVFMC